MSEINPIALNPDLDILEQIKGLKASEVSLIVVGGRCFFPRDICVNVAGEMGWKCSKCGYDADSLQAIFSHWNFCPKCGAVLQEVL